MSKQILGKVVPQKGTDYWTETDKEEIVQEVNSAIEDKKQDYIDNANTYIEELTTLKNSQLEEFNNNATNKTSEINTLVATEKTNIEDLSNEKQGNLTTLANTLNSNISTNATNKTSDFNANVQEKTSQFNSNAATQTLQFTQNVTTKEGEYNSNATTKLGEYNSNASEKLESYNTNASGTIEAYNANVTTKLNDFNSNASTKLDDYNSNATTKLSTYNQNATSKLSDYNTNANTKLETYNTNATTKLDNFNSNAQEKTEQFNSSANAQKIVETRNELERVKNDILETGSDSNSYIHLEDSTMAELQELEVEGVCHQENNIPSPSNPSPISIIENNLTITSCNSNLIKNLELGNINSSNGANVNSSEIIRSEFIKVIPNTYYTIIKEDDTTGSFAFYYKSKNYRGYTDGNGKQLTASTTIQFLIPDGVYYMRIRINTNNVNYKVAIVQGTQETEYEEHIEQQINVNLGDEFLGKLNDTFKDTIKVKFNEEDGNYHLILNKKIGKKVLNGSETWNISDVGNYKQFFTNCDVGNNSVGASSYFGFKPVVNISNSQGNYVYANTGNQFIVFVHPHIDGTDITTIEDWKAFLSENNVEVYYVLATPYEVDLGTIEMPLSYDDTTNIFTDSDLLPSINATYYRNFTKTIQNLQVNENSLKQELININSRLSALETAQANLIDESEVE